MSVFYFLLHFNIDEEWERERKKSKKCNCETSEKNMVDSLETISDIENTKTKWLHGTERKIFFKKFKLILPTSSWK